MCLHRDSERTQRLFCIHHAWVGGLEKVHSLTSLLVNFLLQIEEYRQGLQSFSDSRQHLVNFWPLGDSRDSNSKAHL